MTEVLILLAALFFVSSFKLFTKPSTARNANILAATGMLIGVALTIYTNIEFNNLLFWLVVLGGFLVGAILARFIKMTEMPELVALFNGLGGGASALIAFVDLNFNGSSTISIFSLILGSITISGSFIAVLKLRNKLNIKSGYLLLVNITSLMFLGLLVFYIFDNASFTYLAIVALLFGALRVVLIGGADMPVVVALLNSLSGVAAMSAGFIVSNVILIIGGSLVGASGIILTLLMCESMNRNILNVLKGGFGGVSDTDNEYSKDPISATPEDVAISLSYAEKVIIVPGYGMAVAQAQSSVKDLTDMLKNMGIQVKFAIHPVAGRMPGHMNVLLAEVDIDYEDLIEMDEINKDFSDSDVCLIVGANDVVNPSARNNPDSPIYGMPILDADKSKQVVVIKRSMSPGYAGIANPLFVNENTKMLFSDAKDGLNQILNSFAQV